MGTGMSVFVKRDERDAFEMHAKNVVDATEELYAKTEMTLNALAALDEGIPAGLRTFFVALGGLKQNIVEMQSNGVASWKTFQQILETLDKLDALGKMSLD